jgi:hypothetical protein
MMLAQVANLEPILIAVLLVGAIAALCMVSGLICLVVGLTRKRKWLTVTGLVLASLGLLMSMAVSLALFA